MKKTIIIFTLALITATGCKKSELQLLNPTSPTPGSALVTQGGLEAFALGIWSKTVSGNNLLMHSLENHSIMGDEQFCPYGNFGWRYVNQVFTVTLPPPYNTVIKNPLGNTQQQQMQSLNNLVASTGSSGTNAFVWEWNFGYLVNGEANVLLQAISNNTAVSASEKTVMQAFAYFWKGVAYSRVGSMYLGGIINSNTDGTTNGTYVSHDAIIAEANANFDKAIALLTPYSNTDAVYASTMKVINPAFCQYPTNAAMWVREMYTYEARNYMVNKKVAAMTATDWGMVKTLATKGLVAGDVTFAEGMDPAGTSDLSSTQQHVYEWNNPSVIFTFISERLVQDFKTGDVRQTKGIIPNPSITPNVLSRGIQYGTRYYPALIEKGGYWSTLTHLGSVQFAGSYEENALMLAEANIRTGSIDAGLTYIDQVRTAQGAGLSAVANTGLTLTTATEELRRERRIGLFLRGLAFYDARRNGITAPASAGGGRSNANVLVPNNLLGNTSATGYTVLPCFLDYNYMDYWDIPVNEFTYNAPATGSVVIAN